jgi:colicin import membrane protein
MSLPAWRCIGLLLLASAAQGAVGADDAAPRERIRAERAEVESRFAQSERACYERIVVSSCLDAAAATRREALARLRNQELELNEAQRQKRAARKEQVLDDKKAAKDAAAQAGAPASAPQEKGTPRPATPRPPHEPKPVPSAAQRAAQEAAARRAFEAKQQEAAAHREEVAKRNQEHAKKTQAATPLPIPPASAP